MDTSSAETLKHVAQQLVQAREAQQISLDEIATKTFIPIRILKALEAGETFKLPEPIFVQGFIKRYAKLVGLDGDALAKNILLDTAPVFVDLIKDKPRPPLVDVINKRVSLESLSESKPALVEPVKSDRSVAPPRSQDSIPTPPVADGSVNAPVVTVTDDLSNRYRSMGGSNLPSWLWPAIGGAVLGFGVLAGAIALFKGSQNTDKSQPASTTQPVMKPSSTLNPKAVMAPKPSPIASTVVASPSPSPTTAAGPVNVAVALNDRSWLEVTVDGEVKFEGLLEKGAKQSWSGKKEVLISSGNAGAVMLTYNQSPTQAMGAIGKVETKKFSATN